MWKLLYITILSIIFIACDANSPSSSGGVVTQDEVRFSVVKAPSNISVSISQRLSLTFSGKLNASSVESNSVYIKDINGTKSDTYLEVSNSTVLITPSRYFSPSSQYTIVVTTGVENTLGSSLSEEYQFTFTTSSDSLDTISPAFESILPSNGSTSADVRTEVILQFSKNIDNSAQYNGASLIELIDTTTTNSVAGKMSIKNGEIHFLPSSKLTPSTKYEIKLIGDVYDMYGNTYSGDKSWSFTTSAVAIPFNTGHKVLYSTSITSNNSIYFIEKVIPRTANGAPSENSYLAVASDTKVEFYEVNYINPGYPSLVSKYSFDFSSTTQVNSMDVREEGLMIGTSDSGYYALIVGVDGIIDSYHKDISSSIYGVSSGYKDINTNYLYAVGPNYGLDILEVDLNTTENKLIIKSTTHKDIDGMPLNVQALSDRNNNYNIYLADYKNGIVKLDESGTQSSVVDINGSARFVSHIYDLVYDNLVVSNSIGQFSNIHSDGSISLNILENIGSVSDFVVDSSHSSEYTNLVTNNLDLGVVVFDLSTNASVTSFAPLTGKSKSISILNNNDSGYDYGNDKYVAVLKDSGVIEIYNMFPETSASIVYTTPSDNVNKVAVDESIVISFSSYMDPNTLGKSSFSYQTSKGTNVPFSIVENNGTSITLKADSEMDIATAYIVEVSSDIKDRIGNNIASKKISFTTVNTVSGIPQVTITEDANNDGTITKSELVGDIDVKIILPSETVVGDTLNLTNSFGLILDVTVSQSMIDSGYLAAYSKPADGETVSVTATITDTSGTKSDSANDSAIIGDTTATSAPTVLITTDSNNDGILTTTESSTGDISVKISMPLEASVGDIMTISQNSENVTISSSDISNGYLTRTYTVGSSSSITISAYITDSAGNVSVSGSDSVSTENPPTSPVVTITEDVNNDGTISNSELSGDINVKILLPTEAAVGDTLNITNSFGLIVDAVITQDMIDNGYFAAYTKPSDGETISISATLTKVSGSKSASSTDSAVIGDTTPTAAPTVIIVTDSNNDGILSYMEGTTISVEIKLPAETVAGDILYISQSNENVVLSSADISRGKIMKYYTGTYGSTFTISAYITDTAGNKSSSGTDSVYVEAT